MSNTTHVLSLTAMVNHAGDTYKIIASSSNGHMFVMNILSSNDQTTDIREVPEVVVRIAHTLVGQLIQTARLCL